MIPTTRGFIYSPKHFTEYSKDKDGKPDGIGMWMMDDIAAWNLAWLSFPALDLYLDPAVTHDEIMAEIPVPMLGYVTGLVGKDTVKAYPELRTALFAHPSRLKPVLDSIDLLQTLAGKTGGTEWVATIYQRLGELVGETLTQPIVHRVQGNVVYPDFAAKRQKA